MTEKQVAITTTIITAKRDKIFWVEFMFRCMTKGDYMVSLDELVCSTDGTGTACDPSVTESRPLRRAWRMTLDGSHFGEEPFFAPQNEARPCRTKMSPLMMMPSSVGSMPLTIIFLSSSCFIRLLVVWYGNIGEAWQYIERRFRFNDWVVWIVNVRQRQVVGACTGGKN